MSMIGKSLIHYEISAQIGRGGMGEVYQAKDTKLGRDVAIKILPEEFALDSDRIARFQREAKLLASLNHPNIAAIHGLEESDGTNFLVMELIEGDTLADRIKTGPIPVEEALKLALQIVEALETAHEKGVIHRDLKPSNIKITPEGKIKILDFGLAKAFAEDQGEGKPLDSPTLSEAATRKGIILGTAAYMSPEQARGEMVDKKADIWAFGVVFFEMLTGRQTFTGETVSDTLASVLAREPEWNGLPPNLHPRIRFFLEHCLKKKPKNRLSSISDARVEIQDVLDDPSGVFAQPFTTVKPRQKSRTIFPWIAAAVVLAAVIVGVAIWRQKPSEPRQVMRFTYELPEDQIFVALGGNDLAISPDGTQFVYVTVTGLYLRSVDEMDARLLSGTEGAQVPYFSPDGKWIAFFSDSDSKLKKIATSGGAPVTLADATDLWGMLYWDADETIVYGSLGKGIMRVSANGGTPEQIIEAAENDPTFGFGEPQILPDGESVLFASFGLNTQDKVMLQSLKSGERKELFEGSMAKYLPTGHIVYGLGNSLFAVRFDARALKVIGGPVSVVEGVSQVIEYQYAVSDSGTLVYIPGPAIAFSSAIAAGTPSNQRTLVWVDRNGKEELISAAPNVCFVPKISPDGTKVAMTISSGGKSDIWIYDIVRESMTRLTFNESSYGPLWSVDGKRVAFWSGSIPDNTIYWKAADGTGTDEKIGSLPHRGLTPWSWSKDGKALITGELTPGVSSNVGALSMEGDHEYKPVLEENYDEGQSQISPDGQWIAYSSNESGQYEIFVRPFPEVNNGRWQISTAGGDTPLWSPNGRELFYRNGDAVMAVAVETEPVFKAGKPETLFQGAYIPFRFSMQDASTWDISRDGKRFLMMKEATTAGTATAAEGPPREINIVVNWFEELKQRVPVD